MRKVQPVRPHLELGLHIPRQEGPFLLWLLEIVPLKLVFPQFAVVWALCGLYWLVLALSDPEGDASNYDPGGRLRRTVAASAALDLLLAGSELFHKARLRVVNRRKRREEEEEAAQHQVELRPMAAAGGQQR